MLSLQLPQLIALHKQAPSFISDYEAKQRLVTVQAHMFDTTNCSVERDILASWVHNNNEWLKSNQEKYFTCKRILNVTIEQLEEIHKLHESITNE